MGSPEDRAMRLWGRLEHPTYSIPPKKQRVPSKARGR